MTRFDTDGHEESIEELYRLYAPALRRFFLRRGVPPEIVTDLVHDVFLRLQQAAPRAAVAQPKAYVFRVANNILVDRFRDQRRQGSLNDVHLYDDSTTPDEGPSPESRVGQEQALQLLAQAIERLPPKAKEAFILHKFENLSYHEVAEAMGISVRTVEKHLAKALVECRRQVSRGIGEHRVIPFVRKTR